MHFSGDVTVTANQCTEPDQLFNSTVSVLPGTNITLTCSLVSPIVRWNSSQFPMPVELINVGVPVVESGITFQLDTATGTPLCASATATITNIQGSMDGLDLTCYNTLSMLEFSSTVMFDVIGKWKLVDCLNLFLAHLQYMHGTQCGSTVLCMDGLEANSFLYSAFENLMVKMFSTKLVCNTRKHC